MPLEKKDIAICTQFDKSSEAEISAKVRLYFRTEKQTAVLANTRALNQNLEVKTHTSVFDSDRDFHVGVLI